MWAAMCSHNDVVTTLLNNGAEVDKVECVGRTALMFATRKAHAAVLQTLLEHNADVNKSNNSGWSPLTIACLKGHTSIARILLARDDTQMRDARGRDCLDVAKTDAVKQLVVDHRRAKETQRLVDIGLAFADMQLPLLLLVHIYEQSIRFAPQRVSLFKCWQILKILKKSD
eukprot:TRINITY_DN1430_c0_g1_i2.p1 TRINITY_DN1430_c0_g1~~TRINITY_DN1430_c0_g1_i2.p1  ORF type:complete len:171 (-),score=81.57 TRINITY_DN1430_c0_g1_i2:26-538(-)